MTTTTKLEALLAKMETARIATNAAHDTARAAAERYREAIWTRHVSIESPEAVECYTARAALHDAQERLADAKRAYYAAIDGIW